jgi:RNA polymerase sigma-70 factor (ECF subfamily)
MTYPGSATEPNELKRRGCRRRPSEMDLNMPVEPCDRLLVLRAQSGEHGAFNELVRKYRHRVMKLSMRYTRNRADAEDAAQNTFIKAYWGLKSFRGESAFYSWLHRIAINSAKTVLSLRARNVDLFVSNSRTGDDASDPVATRDLDTPEELALTEEICSAVNASIDALCEKQRTAIVLRELEGLSYSQVASAMSCPVGTVRSRVFRAREAIDNQLRHVFDDGLGRGNNNVSSRSRKISEAAALL